MKRLNINQKIALGVILICISNILKFLSIEHPLNVIAFFQGATISLGMLFLVLGIMKRRKA